MNQLKELQQNARIAIDLIEKQKEDNERVIDILKEIIRVGE